MPSTVGRDTLIRMAKLGCLNINNQLTDDLSHLYPPITEILGSFSLESAENTFLSITLYSSRPAQWSGMLESDDLHVSLVDPLRRGRQGRASTEGVDLGVLDREGFIETFNRFQSPENVNCLPKSSWLDQPSDDILPSQTNIFRPNKHLYINKKNKLPQSVYLATLTTSFRLERMSSNIYIETN